MCLLCQGDCWICMELMSISLDQFYKFVYKKLDKRIPEQMLGKTSVTVSGTCIYHSQFVIF